MTNRQANEILLKSYIQKDFVVLTATEIEFPPTVVCESWAKSVSVQHSELSRASKNNFNPCEKEMQSAVQFHVAYHL